MAVGFMFLYVFLFTSTNEVLSRDLFLVLSEPLFPPMEGMSGVEYIVVLWREQYNGGKERKSIKMKVKLFIVKLCSNDHWAWFSLALEREPLHYSS